MQPLKYAVLFVFFIATILINGLSSRFCLNMANVILNKTLWQEGQTALARQQALAMAARFLSLASNKKPEPVATEEAGEPYTMLSSIVAAEYYLRQKDTGLATFWLQRASNSPPVPILQHALLFPAMIDLAPDGSIVLNGDSAIWKVRRDIKVPTQLTRNEGGSTLTFDKHLTERNRVILSWNYPFTIPYHHQLFFNVKVAKGCTLQIETVIDNAKIRQPLQPDMSKIYYGTDKWETMAIGVEGTELHFIYLLLDLDSSTPLVSQPSGCTMELKSVVFALDAQ